MESDPFTLRGKTVLITGGSSGIGEACARQCARAGATVIVAARRRAGLERVCADLPEGGHRFVVADIASAEDVARLATEIPALDGFVNCAGLSQRQLIRFSQWEDTARLLEVNLTGAMRLTHALVGARKINRGASMVYVASTAASVASPGFSAYGAAKAGLVAFVRGLAVEMAPRQIRANTISPGLVETPMTESVFKGDAQWLKADALKYPLGHGTPQDVAAAVRYFLSDAARWVSGTDFIIDGGFLNYR